MVTHKDMPTGSRQWAAAVDAALPELAHLRRVVERLTKDLGVDFSDPQRQMNQGSTPSVQQPVQMKMASLHDLEVANVQPGDVLMWDGYKWVAGRPPNGPATPTNYGQNSGVHPNDPLDPPVVVEPEPEPGNGTYAVNLYPNPAFRTLGSDGLPAYTDSSASAPSGSYVLVDLGDGTKALRQTAQYEEWGALTSSFGEWPGYDKTKSYVISFDLKIPTPLPSFSLYSPLSTSGSGSAFETRKDALGSGTLRLYILVYPLESYQTFSASIASQMTSGYVDITSVQVTEVSMVHRRLTGNDAPLTESVDITDKVTPGQEHVINTAIGGTGTFSLTVTAETPTGTVTLGNANEGTIPQFVFSVPIDATNVSYHTERPAKDGNWHNVFWGPKPPEFFEGSDPEDANYTYAWLGVPDDSTSERNPK